MNYLTTEPWESPEVMGSLADNIAKLRAARHWTQDQLSEHTGRVVQQTTISAIENGKTTNPGIETIEAIAQAFGTTAKLLRNGPADREGQDEARPADISQLSQVKQAQLNAVKRLKTNGEIWQITTDDMSGFAPKGTYIVADMGAPYTEGDLILAKKIVNDDTFVTIFRLLFSRHLHYISSERAGADSLTNSRIQIIGVVDRETKV